MIKPCNKFTSNSPRRQFIHLLSEVGELGWAVIKLDRQAMGEEAVDCMVSLATFLACCGFTIRDRARLERMVYLKNCIRDYDKSGD